MSGGQSTAPAISPIIAKIIRALLYLREVIQLAQNSLHTSIQAKHTFTGNQIRAFRERGEVIFNGIAE